MSEGAVGDESAGFARTVWPCRVVTVVTPCRCSHVVVDDAVDAVVVVASCRKNLSEDASCPSCGRGGGGVSTMMLVKTMLMKTLAMKCRR